MDGILTGVETEGFSFMDVQGACSYTSVLQGGCNSVLIQQTPAGCVHQESTCSKRLRVTMIRFIWGVKEAEQFPHQGASA